MKPNVTKTITTRTVNQVKIGRAELLCALAHAGYTDIPADARVEFDVPGGGDWSNTSIDIDDQNPLVITWEETSSS